jgi:hypothetical protein
MSDECELDDIDFVQVNIVETSDQVMFPKVTSADFLRKFSFLSEFDLWWCVAFRQDTDKLLLLYTNGESMRSLHASVPAMIATTATSPVVVRRRKARQRPKCRARCPATKGSRRACGGGGGGPLQAGGGMLSAFLQCFTGENKIVPLVTTSNIPSIVPISEGEPLDDTTPVIPFSAETKDNLGLFYQLPIELLKGIVNKLSEPDKGTLANTSSMMHELIRNAERDKMSNREALYLYLASVCILERRRLYFSHGQSSVSCVAHAHAQGDQAELFTITTLTNPDDPKKATRYENRITINGREIVIGNLSRCINHGHIVYDLCNSAIHKILCTTMPSNLPKVAKLALRFKYTAANIISKKGEEHTPDDILLVDGIVASDHVSVLAIVDSLFTAYLADLSMMIKRCKQEATYANFNEQTLGFSITLLETAHLALEILKSIIIGESNASIEIEAFRTHLTSLKHSIPTFASIYGSIEESVTFFNALVITVFDNSDMQSVADLVKHLLNVIVMTNSRISEYYYTDPIDHSFGLHDDLIRLYIPRLIELNGLNGLKKGIDITAKALAIYNYTVLDHAETTPFHVLHPKALQNLLVKRYNTTGALADDENFIRNPIFDVFENLATVCLSEMSTIRVTGTGISCVNGLDTEFVNKLFDNLHHNTSIITFERTLDLDIIFDSAYSELKTRYITDFLKHSTNSRTLEVVLPKLSTAQPDFKITRETSSEKIRDIHDAQVGAWNAENALLEYSRSTESDLHQIKRVLSYYHIYISLFKRIKTKYTPLIEYVRKLELILDNLDCDSIVDIYGGTIHYDEDVVKTASKIEFDENIRPLLDYGLINSVANVTGLFDQPCNVDTDTDIYERSIFELRMLIRNITRYVEIQSALLDDLIDGYLLSSIKEYPGITGYMQSVYRKTKGRAKRVQFPLVLPNGVTRFDRNEIIIAIQSNDSATFNLNIALYFQCALYDYHMTSSRSTIIPALYGNADETSRSLAIASLQHDLEIANGSLYEILAPTEKSGGALQNKASKYVLVVTNTATMRTLNKPIFKIDRQSKVRHNRELVLVSKYKLLLVKRHKRQVKFEICKRA